MGFSQLHWHFATCFAYSRAYIGSKDNANSHSSCIAMIIILNDEKPVSQTLLKYSLSAVRQDKLAGLLGGLDACAAQAAYALAQLRAVVRLPDVDQQVTEQRQLHVDLRYQLRTI